MSPNERGADSAHSHVPRRLVGDRFGGVYVEYIVLLGAVAIITLPSFLLVGKALVTVFGSVRDTLALPFP